MPRNSLVLRKVTVPVSDPMYPSKDEYFCVRCKDRTFSSWNEFENHHAKHAVDFTFAKLPIVKLCKLVVTPNKSELPTVILETSSHQVGNDITNSQNTSAVEVETNSTCQESYETSSPVNPLTHTTRDQAPPKPNNNLLEPQPDSNVSDLSSVEKLGEENSFLNLPSSDSCSNDTVNSSSMTDSSSILCANAVCDLISDHSVPVAGSSSSMVINQEVQSSKAELNTVSSSIDKCLEQWSGANSGNENIISDKSSGSVETELPKSRGQLRLVPYRSLLSPSCALGDQMVEEQSSLSVPHVHSSNTTSMQQAMVAIPEENLTELNVGDGSGISKKAVLEKECGHPDKDTSQTSNVKRFQQKQPTTEACRYQTNSHQQNQYHQQQSLNVSLYQQQQPYQQINLNLFSGHQQHSFSQSPQLLQPLTSQHVQYPPSAYNPNHRSFLTPMEPTNLGFSRAAWIDNSNISGVVSSSSNLPVHSFTGSTNVTSSMLANTVTPRQSLSTFTNGTSGNPPSQSRNSSELHFIQRPMHASSIQHIRLQAPVLPPNQSRASDVLMQLPHRHLAISSISRDNNPPNSSVRSQLQSHHPRPNFILIRPQQPNLGPRASPSNPLQKIPISHSAHLRPAATTSVQATPLGSRVYLYTHPRQAISSTSTQSQKRPVVVEGGINTTEPPQKSARIGNDHDSTAESTGRQSRDCEILVVQKKQVGLPVIQSVEGNASGGPSSTKPKVQALQTPSVASLMSNPNITVTPAKNKEIQSGLESLTTSKANSSLTAVVDTNTRLIRPETVNSIGSVNSLQNQPSWRNPLTCQVCNETFNSQSLLKTHLVLHLKRTLQVSARSNTTHTNNGVHTRVGLQCPPISKEASLESLPNSSNCSTDNTQKQCLDRNPQKVKCTVQQTSSACTLPTSTSLDKPTSEKSTVPCIQRKSLTESERNELYIPVFDLKRQDVINQFKLMGIDQFLPVSKVNSMTQHANRAIPILSSSALRQANTMEPPLFCGVVNMGTSSFTSLTPNEIP